MSATNLLTKKPAVKNAIALYPKFSKLDLKHKPIFDQFANKFGHYSDFNFISIFSWDTKNDTKVSMLNNNLVISMPDYITGKTCYSMIGDNKIDESLKALLTKTDNLKLIPEVIVKNIKNPKKFIVTEDPDNHDYIYLVKNLIELKGQKYKDIRNKISKFKREYQGFDKFHVSTTSIVNLDRFKCFHDVFYRWSKDKDLTDEEFKLEKTAIYRLIEYSKEFNLLIVEIKHGEELLAFSINEIVAPGFAITHFEKAIKIHKYFNSYVVEQAAKLLNDFGCEKVNWEQDLGLPGLRQSKSCYCPTEMLNKYQVKLKN
jgi:hypothetical protein